VGEAYVLESNARSITNRVLVALYFKFWFFYYRYFDRTAIGQLTNLSLMSSKMAEYEVLAKWPRLFVLEMNLNECWKFTSSLIARISVVCFSSPPNLRVASEEFSRSTNGFQCVFHHFTLYFSRVKDFSPSTFEAASGGSFVDHQNGL